MEAISIKNEKFVRRSITVIGLSFALVVLLLSLWVPLVNAVANHFLKGLAHVSAQSIAYKNEQLFLNDVSANLPSNLRIGANSITIKADIQQILDGQLKAKAIVVEQLKTYGLAEDLSIKQIAAANVELDAKNALLIEKLIMIGYKQQSIKLSELIGAQLRYGQDALFVDSLKIKEAVIDAPKIALSSLALNAAEIKNLSKPTEMAYSIKAIEVKDLRSDILGAEVNSASISTVEGNTSSIRIEKASASEANIDLKRSQNGQWLALPVRDNSSEQKDFAWAVSQVVLEESKVSIEDGAVSPAFNDELLIEKLRAENVGGEMVDANAQLAATLGKYTPIQLEAEFSNQTGAFAVKAKGEVKGLVLNHIAGYISNDLGHNFERGQLSDTFTLAIKDKHVTMSNQLEVHDLKAIAIEGKQGPPLDLAVKLLQDKDGILRITVPVEGDLDNPEFKIAQALTPVITKAVTLAAASNIQPLGTVLLVKDLLDKTLLKVSFEPAFFEAGTTALSKGQVENMRELAKKLIKTPNLQVRLCGVVTPVDKAEPEEAFKKLGEARANAVENLLLAERLPSDQIIPCPPYRDDAEAAKPRVDITL
jgi:outer membrane protein OmpA-like peptidoglycan-associated protein